MKLYEPIKIGALEVKNRIVMVPVGDSFNDRGMVTQRQCDFWARRAQGGAALIITSYAAVDGIHRLPINTRIDDDRFVEGLSKLAGAIKAGGARAAIQIYHPGRRFSAAYSGVQPIAPSAGPCFEINTSSPYSEEWARAMSQHDIDGVINAFAEAARRAKEAGFDLVEVHGAHGNLLGQFLSPLTNKRRDRYGGNAERRATFAVEILKAVRARVGAEFPIGVRFSADEHVEGGLTLEEAKVIAGLLEKAGASMLNVSGGHTISGEWIMPNLLMPKFTHFSSSEAIRQVVSIPVAGVGRVRDPEEAERLLQQGKADLIGVGRALLADPDFGRKGLEGRSREITRCIDCLYVCVPPARNSSQTAACLVNPDVGYEGAPEIKASHPRKVLVLGAGPAGMEAARVARTRGHDVTVWERNEKAGGRWSFLAKPYVSQQMEMLKNLGVKVALGKKLDAPAVAKLKPDIVLVTPDAEPVGGVRTSPGENVISVDEALGGKDLLGDRVVIVGGGNHGCEAAYAFSSKKRAGQITVVERGAQIGYGLPQLIRISLVDRLSRSGVAFLKGTEVVSIRDGNVEIRNGDGRKDSLKADVVIMALGSEPDYKLLESLRGKVKDLIVLPYCDEPTSLRVAIDEGRAVARRI